MYGDAWAHVQVLMEGHAQYSPQVMVTLHTELGSG